MRHILTIIVSMLFIGTSWATTPPELTFKEGENHLKISNVEKGGFEFDLSITKAYFKSAEKKEGNFFYLQTKGFTKATNIGNPDLPSKGKLIEVPFGANVKIEILSSESQIVNLNEKGLDGIIVPCQPSVAKCDDGTELTFEMNAEVYNTNAFYADELVQYEESGIMRGTRLGRIEMNPFQYNPVTNELKVYTALQVKVTFEGADYAKTEKMKNIYGNSMFNNLLTKTMNYTNDAKPLNQHEPVKMTIIADRMFEATLAPFVEWKTMTGIETTVRYTDEAEVGSTTTSIKSYLQGVYEAATTENPAPSFVLLVGDIQQIPAFNGTTDSHVSDLYYFTYDGAGDLIPDINYGRFSAQTVAHLENIIEKTLLYEKYEMTDPSYLENAVLVAGVDGSYATVYGNGAINYIHDFYLNEDNGVNAYMYHYPASGSSGAAIIQNISDGVAIGNYTAHCSPSGWADPAFVTSDIAGLQNEEKLGLLIGNCCQSNQFNDNECFGEALLRVAGKGAIGYIGGSNSTYWDEDYYWATGYGTAVQYPEYENFGNGSYDLLYHFNIDDQPMADWAPTQSQVNLAGQLAVEESNSSRKTYYWEIYHLMGDPTLMPWVGVPDAMTPSYMASIPMGLTSLQITNIPPYARVALSDEGVLLGTALANESGAATLEFDAFTAPTTAELVITAQFKQPFIGELGVIPSDEPFVVYDSYTLNDGTSGNGLLDYGETAAINITVRNVGTVSTTGVELTLTTEDTYTTITDGAETLGDAAAETSYTLNDAFAFEVAENVPDQHNITFVLTANDGTNDPWVTEFSIKANAPVIELLSATFSDPDGNNNGNLDPGEAIMLTLQVANTGHAASQAVNSTLTATNSNLSVVTGTQNIQSIAAQAVTEITHIFTVSSDAEVGAVAQMAIQIVSGETQIDQAYAEPIGLIIEDFETGDFTRYEWVNDATYPWTVQESTVYEGTYAAKSGDIGSSQETNLSITVDVAAAGVIKFMVKPSSENNYDFLRFYIDETEMGEWAGAGEWAEVTYPVTAGEHTFKWEYSKDGSLDSNDDCGYIDYITFPAFAGGGGSGENNAPEIATAGDTMAYTNHSFLATITATDADAADVLTFSCNTKPEWMTFTDNGDKTATLTADAAPMSAVGQTFNIPVSVTDGTAFANAIITVHVQRYPTAINNMESASKLLIYPNPAKDEAHINYELTKASQVQATIYNVTGQIIKTIVSENQQPAEYNYSVDLSNIANGVYFINISVGQDNFTQKLIINK